MQGLTYMLEDFGKSNNLPLDLDLELSNTYKLCGDEKKHNHAERVN